MAPRCRRLRSSSDGDRLAAPCAARGFWIRPHARMQALETVRPYQGVPGLPKQSRELGACRSGNIISRLDLDLRLAFEHPCIDDVALEAIAMRIEEWAEHVDRYSEWSRLAAADGTLRNNGHSALADQIADGALTSERAVEDLRHARAELLWQLAAKEIRNSLSYVTRTGQSLLTPSVSMKLPGANRPQLAFERAIRRICQGAQSATWQSLGVR